MSRSKWKGLFINSNFLDEKVKVLKKQKTWCRSSIIPSTFIGRKILVYNGKEFKSLFVSREKIGFKFGEFIFTRINNKRKAKVKKSKKK